MTCADLERSLIALLAGKDDPADRDGRLAPLLEHVKACPNCRDVADLVEFLALPPAERDFADPPADAYWEEFETGLRRRLAQSRPRAGWGRAPWTGIAAALLLAAAGVWLALSPGGTGPPGERAGERGEERGEIPDTLEALLRRAEPDEALAVLDFVVGLPGVSDTADGAAHDAAEQSDSPGAGGPLFPDPEQMDAEARRALLDWLRERAARGRGVDS